MSINVSCLANSLAYVGVEANTPPNLTVNLRRPTSGDYIGYTLGSLWLYTVDPSPQEVWMLVRLAYQEAFWVELFPGGGGAGALEVVTAAGSAFTVDGVVNFIPGTNINVSAVPDGGNNLQVNLTDNVLISGHFVADSYIATGSYFGLPATTDANTGVLEISGTSFLHAFGGLSNVYVGANAGNFTNTSTGMTGIGNNALKAVTTSLNTTAVGSDAGALLTSGDNNSFFGEGSGSGLTTGSGNTLIGTGSGSNYVTIESGNVILGVNPGETGESNTMRLGGGTGAGPFQQERLFASGVNGNILANTVNIMTISSTADATLDQVGIIAPAIAGFVLTSTGLTSPPTFQAPAGGGGGLTWIRTAATTLNLVANNGYVSTNPGVLTFTLPLTATLGSIIKIVTPILVAGTTSLTIAQNAGQKIYGPRMVPNAWQNRSSTTGITGGIIYQSSDLSFGSITISLLCVEADLTWSLEYPMTSSIIFPISFNFF